MLINIREGTETAQHGLEIIFKILDGFIFGDIFGSEIKIVLNFLQVMYFN